MAAGEIMPLGSRRSWLSAASISRSLRWAGPEDDPFGRSSRRHDDEDDEENLRWAALEKLRTYARMRRGIIRKAVDGDDAGEVVDEVDLATLDPRTGRELMERVFKAVEDDNERFLRRFHDRLDAVGIELPQIEVRYESLSVQADVHVGNRALPTLLNSTINVLEGLFSQLGSSNKRTINILKDVSGIIKPSRMTLLLGPPASGKSTLMRALTGKPAKNLKVSGDITYCGHTFSEFYPERTSAYVSRYDLHNGEMTVRETMDFSRRCLGIGVRYDLLSELARREQNAGIKPDPEIDALMKATAVEGKETNVITDLIFKVLGLDICADIIVGDEMKRGISGGQKRRVTTGYSCLVAMVLLDEPSVLDHLWCHHIAVWRYGTHYQCSWQQHRHCGERVYGRKAGLQARIPRLCRAGSFRLRHLIPLPLCVRHQGLELPETVEGGQNVFVTVSLVERTFTLPI